MPPFSGTSTIRSVPSTVTIILCFNFLLDISRTQRSSNNGKYSSFFLSTRYQQNALFLQQFTIFFVSPFYYISTKLSVTLKL